jgi:hypothetical protein
MSENQTQNQGNQEARKIFIRNFNTVNQAMLRSGFKMKELQKIVQHEREKLQNANPPPNHEIKYGLK